MDQFLKAKFDYSIKTFVFYPAVLKLRVLICQNAVSIYTQRRVATETLEEGGEGRLYGLHPHTQRTEREERGDYTVYISILRVVSCES